MCCVCVGLGSYLDVVLTKCGLGVVAWNPIWMRWPFYVVCIGFIELGLDLVCSCMPFRCRLCSIPRGFSVALRVVSTPSALRISPLFAVVHAVPFYELRHLPSGVSRSQKKISFICLPLLFGTLTLMILMQQLLCSYIKRTFLENQSLLVPRLYNFFPRKSKITRDLG